MTRIDDLLREVEGNALMHRLVESVERDRRRGACCPRCGRWYRAGALPPGGVCAACADALRAFVPEGKKP